MMLTLLYQRQVCSMKLLSDMLEVTPECIGHLVAETRRVLEDHGHQPGYAPSRFAAADAHSSRRNRSDRDRATMHLLG
ncbi:hypothetical protein ACIBJF_29910 [Streptomyces sp. NPDC050743]|uniref:hypothetical protein n=1 Tax=Streptomyces sp. NPDC050743 TaxID=3365634 RepID=UPI0037A54912